MANEAKLIIGHVSFPYSVTPGALPPNEIDMNGTKMQPGSIAMNIADRILFGIDQNGDLFEFIGGNYDDVLAAHFGARNPHGMHDTEVTVTLGNVTVDGTYNTNIIKRIGAGDATITLQDACPVGTTVQIDNVRTESGTVTITSESGTMNYDAEFNDQTTTLTGKGQAEIIKIDATNWEITDLTI